MRVEREAAEGRDACALSVILMANDMFRARLRFQPGMESVHGDGATIAEAIQALSAKLRP